MKNHLRSDFLDIFPYILVNLIVGTIISGCNDGGPALAISPSAEEIFEPTDFNFSTGGLVQLDVAEVTDGIVCVTLDGSPPEYNGGTCSGGSTFAYSVGSLSIACSSIVQAANPTLEEYPVRIAFEWDNGSTTPYYVNLSKTYTLDCSEYIYLDINTTGEISGDVAGTSSAEGEGKLNTQTGNIDYRIVNTVNNTTSIIGPTNTTTTLNGLISGTYTPPGTLNPVTGASAAIKCVSNSGFDICGFILLNVFEDIGIQESSITIGMSPGSVTNFQTINSVLQANQTAITEMDWTMTTR